jgi:hypothetical protein
VVNDNWGYPSYNERRFLIHLASGKAIVSGRDLNFINCLSKMHEVYEITDEKCKSFNKDLLYRGVDSKDLASLVVRNETP